MKEIKWQNHSNQLRSNTQFIFKIIALLIHEFVSRKFFVSYTRRIFSEIVFVVLSSGRMNEGPPSQTS